ncbi:MAG: FAD-dependent oxidoreductase [Syntrophorhabdales bacterium]|jgi:succinate dehydrogenase/fumarate reductase flavoprotein subunit
MRDGFASLNWPYPVGYGAEKEVDSDVLILGGGLAGCFAAISAVRQGAKVALVDKAGTKRSGSAGSGIDHWMNAATNPCSQVTPEELTQAIIASKGGWACGIAWYIACRESYECLLDLERMGMKVRDSEDLFRGAEFRDEETKLLFAYDYKNRYDIRIWGTSMKPVLYKECRRLGVDIYERVMTTGLLTEGGKPGGRVVGATGVNSRTGEFYVFKAKATVLATGVYGRVWQLQTEQEGMSLSHISIAPNNTGDGASMAWKAGAEFTAMEWSSPSFWGDMYGLGVAAYATGAYMATWFPCTIVDAKGKEVPWVDCHGNVIPSISQRCQPAPGQKLYMTHGSPIGLRPGQAPRELVGPHLISDLPERIEKGEFALPLYADLPGMPEHERRAIFGLMVGQEGKTWIAYRNLTEAGFDPDKDLLQHYYAAVQPRFRNTQFTHGGLVVDWDLRTNVEGLYAAGQEIFSTHSASLPCATGKYVGRGAARYAGKTPMPEIDREQVEKEKARVYALVKRKEGMNWKELEYGIAKVMQDYCGDVRNEELLELGLKWFKELKEGEAATLCARNPHELVRSLEVLNIITVGEIIMHACLARRASSAVLGHKRLDYPEIDPPEWKKFVTARLRDGEVQYGELPMDYWGALKENYQTHCNL